MFGDLLPSFDPLLSVNVVGSVGMELKLKFFFFDEPNKTLRITLAWLAFSVLLCKIRQRHGVCDCKRDRNDIGKVRFNGNICLWHISLSI